MSAKRNVVSLSTTRAQVGIYMAVSGSGAISGGSLDDNDVYVSAGQTAYSVSSTSNSAVINGAVTAADGDTTPTVRGVRTLLIPSNTGATAISQLDDAIPGQRVTIIATNATNPSTLADSGNFTLSAAWAPGIGDTITLATANGTAWYEVCRSDN